MKYNNHLNYQNRNRFILKVRLIILSILVLGLLTAAYAYFSVMLQREANTESNTTTAETSSYFSPSVSIFRSPFYQFQANSSWAEVPADSTQHKFVYRSLRSNLIEHELVVYVNQIPANISSNRVMPVNLKNVGEFLPLAVSEHCAKVAGEPSFRPREVVLERVRLLCHSDSSTYTVLAGLVDGSTTLNLPRPDGSTTSYSIFYTNLKATPEASQLTQILESFQTR